MDGVILVDKPKGLSSFDVVRKLRKKFSEKSIGYLGTLDPLATGLLVMFLGKATKLIKYFSGLDKEYIVDLELGKISDTFDNTGRVRDFNEGKCKLPAKRTFQNQLKHFLGSHLQTQPAFSAIRIRGQRAYDLARKGISLNLGKRMVAIHTIEVQDIEMPTCRLKIACSSGTYVRSFIHELGLRLETGAVMTGLQRTRVGDFVLGDTVRLDKLSEQHVVGMPEIISRYFDSSATASKDKSYLLKKFQN